MLSACLLCAASASSMVHRCIGFRVSHTDTSSYKCIEILAKATVLSLRGRCGRGVPDPDLPPCCTSSKLPCLGLHFRISQIEKILLGELLYSFNWGRSCPRVWSKAPSPPACAHGQPAPRLRGPSMVIPGFGPYPLCRPRAGATLDSTPVSPRGSPGLSLLS